MLAVRCLYRGRRPEAALGRGVEAFAVCSMGGMDRWLDMGDKVRAHEEWGPLKSSRPELQPSFDTF